MELTQKILEIVHANIEDLPPDFNDIDADLSELGMDSVIFIKIIIALEDFFAIDFPDQLLLISITNTIRKMAEIVSEERITP